MSGKKGPTRVGELVDAFLEEKGVRKQIARQTAVDAWAGVVGEAIARVSRARAVEEGTLFVEVRSSAWMMELDFMKGDILRRLNEAREGGEIEKIVFLLGGGGDNP